jgi:repressor LexA
MNLTPKQLRVLQFIRDSRRRNGYSPTMQEIADALGITKVTVFEHAEALIGKGALVRDANKARSLSIPADVEIPETVVGAEDPFAMRRVSRTTSVRGRGDRKQRGELTTSTGTDSLGGDGRLRFPLLGRIAAGYPIEKFAQDESLSLEEVFGPRRGQRGNLFALQVDGDSMRDEGIFDGDYVIVERRDTARNGERVVALLPNGETTLKTLYRERDGTIRLQPANPEFAPIIVRDCSIQGVVIGVLRRY